MSQEVLASTRVRSGECHSHRAPLVALAIHLVTDRIAGSTVAVVARIAILRDEVRHDAVKASVAVVSRASETEKIRDRDWSVGAVHLETERAALGVNGRIDLLPRQHWQ